MVEDQEIRPEDVQSQSILTEDIEVWRRQLIDVILRIVAVAAGVALVISGYYDYVNQNWTAILLYVAAYAFYLFVIFWKKSTYTLQTGTLLAILFGVGCINYYYSGFNGEGHVMMLTFAFFASVFWGRLAGVAMLVIVAETMAVFGWAYSTGRLMVPVSVQNNATEPLAWVSGGVVVLGLGIVAILAQSYLLLKLSDALEQSRELAQRLDLRGDQLRSLVDERTQALDRRSVQLTTAAQVAREAAAIHDLDQLLSEVVNLISGRFDYYHAGVFLLDESAGYMELRAASSEGGQRMLVREHRLRVGETGVVGYAAGMREVRIARDVGEDAVYFDNPDLPDTRSEVALPLQTQERLIGVLDVQSERADAFSEEDVLVLRTLADQIALVISNAQLLREVEERMEAERRAYGEIRRAGWQDLIRQEEGLGFVRDRLGLDAVDEDINAHTLQVLRTGEAATDVEDGRMMAVPVKLRDQIVGVINARKASEDRGWGAEERILLMQLGEQIGLALENARLYQETRRRAAQEQLVGEVTTRMRASLNLEDILETTVQELGQRLDLDEVVLQLVEDESPVTGG
jgi:GAF domain-containing protein